ncbi:MAG: hypothetical protein ACRERD_27455 [Candidatus Binatia bacterium]
MRVIMVKGMVIMRVLGSLGDRVLRVHMGVLASGMVMMERDDLRLGEKTEECSDNDECEAASLSPLCVHRSTCPLWSLLRMQ